MHTTFSYAAIHAASQRAAWRLEDVLGADARLDFSRPFLPEALVQTGKLDFLNPAEKRLLNQIRGHNYLYLFGLVEEFILPFLESHIDGLMDGDATKLRALNGFIAEEAKHIALFKRFRQLFQRSFTVDCAVIGPAEAVAAEVLRHPPLAVALIILHIEWMTQRHYLDSVRDEVGLDPCFSDLLRYHWIEEAQHAKLDTLIVEELAGRATPAEINAAIEGYLAILAFLDAGLTQQVAFDIASFAQAANRRFGDSERRQLEDTQLASMRWTFIGSGMTHETFCNIVNAISPDGAARIAAAAAIYG
jgi:hypothetical protein